MEDLKKILIHKSKQLPGMASHQKMMPSNRQTIADDRKKNTLRAAVLVPIYKENDDYHIVFIKRTRYEGAHSNQVSFPGGKCEPSDKNLISTALREANEEIGLLPDKVDVICQLSEVHIPVSNHLVTPYVGILTEKPVFKTSDKEVQYVIVTTLSHLKNPEIIKSSSMQLNRGLVDVPYFDVDGEMIWGATAMMLSELLDLLPDSFN